MDSYSVRRSGFLTKDWDDDGFRKKTHFHWPEDLTAASRNERTSDLAQSREERIAPYRSMPSRSDRKDQNFGRQEFEMARLQVQGSVSPRLVLQRNGHASMQRGSMISDAVAAARSQDTGRARSSASAQFELHKPLDPFGMQKGLRDRERNTMRANTPKNRMEPDGTLNCVSTSAKSGWRQSRPAAALDFHLSEAMTKVSMIHYFYRENEIAHILGFTPQRAARSRLRNRTQTFVPY